MIIRTAAGRARLCALLALLALATPPAWACSTCKCGDYTLTLLGAEKPFPGRLRAGVDYLDRSEEQGEGVSRRETEETRLLMGVAYSPAPRVTFAAQLPYVRKRIRDASLAEDEAQGWGDADLLLRLVLWRDHAAQRHLGGLRLGVRVPTSEQIRDSAGKRIDIDAQPDAGAWAPNAGLWYGYFRFPWFASASATHYAYGAGRQDFHPGDATVVSLLLQRSFGTALALQGGFDARHAGSNRFGGARDADSGGTLTMAYAGLALRLFSDELLLNLGVQEPIADSLDGSQTEGTAFRAGFTYDFSTD